MVGPYYFTVKTSVTLTESLFSFISSTASIDTHFIYSVTSLIILWLSFSCRHTLLTGIKVPQAPFPSFLSMASSYRSHLYGPSASEEIKKIANSFVFIVWCMAPCQKPTKSQVLGKVPLVCFQFQTSTLFVFTQKETWPFLFQQLFVYNVSFCCHQCSWVISLSHCCFFSMFLLGFL